MMMRKVRCASIVIAQPASPKSAIMNKLFQIRCRILARPEKETIFALPALLSELYALVSFVFFSQLPKRCCSRFLLSAKKRGSGSGKFGV